MLNSQCSILIRSGCRIAKCSTDKIPSASIKTARTRGRFSFRMRIEHWELNIGQILPSPHSAKLFLREPLVIDRSKEASSCRLRRAHTQRLKNPGHKRYFSRGVLMRVKFRSLARDPSHYQIAVLASLLGYGLTL